MGCGSSARGRSVAKVSPANEVTVFDGPALEAQADRRNREHEDDEVRWLRMLIEKEKAEKEWLMSRYERTERDLQARNEECARLRLQITDTRDRAPLEKMLPANGTRTSENSAPVTPNPISPVPNLKERRGLKLSVETNSRVTSKPAENVANAGSQLADSASKMVLQASASQKSLEQSREIAKQDAAQNLTQAPSTRTKDFLASLNQDRSGELVEPMTAMASVGARGSWKANNEEPMSPLLRRRREGPRTSLRDKYKSTPTDMGSGLSVLTPKVFQMDDVPQTPKRIPATPATARRRQETMWTTIVEDVVEDEDK